SGFKSAMSQLVFEVFILGENFLDAVNEEFFRADNQDLVQAFLFKLAQGHAVLFEELDEVLAGNAPVLAARDAVAAEPARVEPFTHRPWRDFTDLRDLAGGKDFFHGRHSSLK